MKPYLERFGDRALVDIRTADVQGFIADLRKPRTIHRRGVRVLSASRVNKIIDLQEEAALLAHAPRHVQALLISAIDTGMRSGECWRYASPTSIWSAG